MHQSIHQQLIRGIQGLNPAQARQLQDLLAAVKDGSACATSGFDDAPPHPDETGNEADALVTLAIREEDPVPVDSPAQEVADDEADRPPHESGIQALAPTEAPDVGPASDDAGIVTETVAAVEADGDLPQPVDDGLRSLVMHEEAVPDGRGEAGIAQLGDRRNFRP